MRASTLRRFSLASLFVVCGSVGACATGIDGTEPILEADGGTDAGHGSNLAPDGDDTLDVDATMNDASSSGDDDATPGDDGTGDSAPMDGSHEAQDARVDAETDGGSHDAASDAADAADATTDAADAGDASDASDASDADASDADAATSACMVGTGFAAQGTTCSDNGGVLCDGAGTCTQTYTVVRVGTGLAALDGKATSTYLETYYPTANATAVSTVALPIVVVGTDQPLTLTGSSTTEGFATRSTDGHFIVLPGYAAAPGTATSGTTRVVGRVTADGTTGATVDTTTTLPSAAFSGSNVRGAASVDGSAFWVSGTSSTSAGGGIWYVGLGAATPGIQVNDSENNTRASGIFGGQLYTATASGTAGIYAIGATPPPTTAGQMATALPGLTSAEPGAFVMFDLDATVAGVDTVFVAEENANGVERWTSNGTTWTKDATFTPITVSTIGVTGWITSTGVTLIATTSSATEQVVVPTTGTVTTKTLETAATDTAYRGVSLAAH